MISICINSIRRPGMHCLFFLSAIVLLGGGNAVRATDGVSPWSGNITTPPNIDATNFYNSGRWDILASPKPFMTASTLNYTNIGTMNSSIGWEFDFGPSGSGNGGPRSWSSKFLNDSLGTISTTSGIGNQLTQVIPVGYLWVSATNIVNKGILSADGFSEIKLTGSTVDIHRSTIEIVPPVGPGLGLVAITTSNFIPDAGIFDQYWVQSGITNMNSSTIWNGLSAASPIFNVSAPCGVVNLPARIGPFIPAVSDSTNIFAGFLALTATNLDGSTTNILLATNIIRQAVFIYLTDSNITGQVRFSPSPIPTNFFMTVAVELATPSINFATLALETNSIFLVDTLASTTNGGLLANVLVNPYALCSTATFRPRNYNLSRADPGDFALGQPGAGQPVNNFLYQTDFTNALVIAKDAGYSAIVSEQVLQLSTAYSITNQPGRVRISANNLNLSQARIRGLGEVLIQASNLISSAGAIVECPNLSYNLGSTAGNLNVTNLAVQTVNGFQGTVSCWSAVWLNSEIVVTPNYDTNGVFTPLTNSVQVGLYALLVDAGQLTSRIPVVVQDLILHSTNMVISDSMTVGNTFLLDGQSFTLNGSLNLSGALAQNWTYATAPKLRYFTNNGSFFIFNDAHFGDDGPTNYLAFVNTGIIFSAGETINARNLQIINGINQTFSGNFSAITQTGQLSGASIFSARDINFTANSLLVSQTTLSAQNALNFNVTGSLSDNRFGSGNNFFCQNGFNLLTKPTTGDLLGTVFTTVANFGGAEVFHNWAGKDYGPLVAGFTNNVAIGALVLSQGPVNTNTFEPLFDFYGTTAANGMYVSNLDLSQLTDFANEIYIDPSLNIYFITANLNPGVDTGVLTPEEFLDGQFGNHLHWVQGVTSLGQKKSNASARFQLQANYGASGNLQLSGVIMPAQTNIIQASTNLVHWDPIYTNIGSYSNIGPTTITDPNSQYYRTRFYRVVPGP
jgi:hypothetical protein